MLLPVPAETGAARLVALAAGTLGLVPLGIAAGVLLGLPPAQVLALALLIPAGLSTTAALGVACLLAGARFGPGRAGSPAAGTAGPPAPAALRRSPLRRQTESELARVEAGLLRAVELGADDVELMRYALALHEARLALAKVLLCEDGALPRSLEDELLIAHRGTSAWLRAQTS